jgi:hypothetical protein
MKISINKVNVKLLISKILFLPTSTAAYREVMSLALLIPGDLFFYRDLSFSFRSRLVGIT